MIFPAALLAALAVAPRALAVVNYADDFIDPTFIVNQAYNASTTDAQQTIIQWANSLASKGPWSVTTKEFLAPSGDKHDYMSWKPYQWPDCSQAGNTTALTIDQMFKLCTYSNFDGKLNADARHINNIGDFDDMANAILFNSLAWGVTRSRIYATRVIGYINTWFLDPDTYMNPNLNYAQMSGGPNGQVGTHTGILDLKAFAKIASGVVLLREGNAEGWNSTFDGQLQAWVKNYTTWLTTNQIALDEKQSSNNHGTFYFAQLASLYIIADDKPGAVSAVQEYFRTLFLNQIAPDGNQPLEADRTRPFHYLSYNLAAMITVGRLGQYAGWPDAWTQKTANGATIKDAAAYAMKFPAGAETESELFPVIAAIAAIYGDSDGAYASWLDTQSRGKYVEDASFFWNQPLSDSGRTRGTYVTYAGATGGTATLSTDTKPTGGTNNGKGSSSSGSGKSGASKVVPSLLTVGVLSLGALLI